MKRLIALAAVTCLTAMFVDAQIQSYPLTAQLPTDAVAYYLPQTALTITVTERCVREIPGEFARYAERCLGISDVIASEQEIHEIVRVEFDTKTAADPLKAYYMTAGPTRQSAADGSKSKTVSAPTSMNVSLSPEGMLQAVNADPLPAPTGADAGSKQCEKCEPFRSETGCHNRLFTQEMRQANSSARQAELAAKQIFSLRETRLALLQGELDNMPTDGEALKLFLQQLDDMERAYTEMFVGYRSSTCRRHTVEFLPESLPTKAVAFRFSSEKGLLPSDDFSGAPVYVTIDTQDSQKISQVPDSLEKTISKKNTVREEEAPALYYYRPRTCEVSLVRGREELLCRELVLAQFGDLLRLKASESLQVVCDPRTGALVRRY